MLSRRGFLARVTATVILATTTIYSPRLVPCPTYAKLIYVDGTVTEALSIQRMNPEFGKPAPDGSAIYQLVNCWKTSRTAQMRGVRVFDQNGDFITEEAFKVEIYVHSVDTLNVEATVKLPTRHHT